MIGERGPDQHINGLGRGFSCRKMHRAVALKAQIGAKGVEIAYQRGLAMGVNGNPPVLGTPSRMVEPLGAR